MKKNIIFIFAILSISILTAMAQPMKHTQVDRPDPTLAPQDERDSVEYKYEFFKGDTLYYRTDNRDSIVINYNPALTKIRNERFKIWCDSTAKVLLKPDSIFKDKARTEFLELKVDTVKLMFMTMMFTELNTREKILNQDTISERKTSPWLNKKVNIVMDSTGRRYEVYSEMNSATMSPGGPFTPEFMPRFGSGMRFENATWLEKDTIYMIENAIPPPISYASSLWRAQNDLDTLGHSCISLRYARTGRAAYYVDSPQQFLHVTAILNNGLQMRLDKEDFVPVHIFSTMEQKQEHHEKDSDRTTPVWHYLTIDYVLEKMVPSSERIEIKAVRKAMLEQQHIEKEKAATESKENATQE